MWWMVGDGPPLILRWELFYLISRCCLSHKGQRSQFRVENRVAPPELAMSRSRSDEVTGIEGGILWAQNGRACLLEMILHIWLHIYEVRVIIESRVHVQTSLLNLSQGNSKRPWSSSNIEWIEIAKIAFFGRNTLSANISQICSVKTFFLPCTFISSISSLNE